MAASVGMLYVSLWEYLGRCRLGITAPAATTVLPAIARLVQYLVIAEAFVRLLLARALAWWYHRSHSVGLCGPTRWICRRGDNWSGFSMPLRSSPW